MHQMFTSLHYREPTEYRQNVNVQGQATGAHLLGGIDISKGSEQLQTKNECQTSALRG